MHKISLYYSLQDLFVPHGCPHELTWALTFHARLLLYREALSQVQSLISHSSGIPHCHAIPSSSGLGWHSCRGPLLPTGIPSLLYLGSDSTCFLYPAWAWISCASSLPKQMSFSSTFSSYTLIMATAASPQHTSVDDYLPLPYLMTSDLYCSEKERNWEKGKKNKKKMHRKMKRKEREEKRWDRKER